MSWECSRFSTVSNEKGQRRWGQTRDSGFATDLCGGNNFVVKGKGGKEKVSGTDNTIREYHRAEQAATGKQKGAAALFGE